MSITQTAKEKKIKTVRNLIVKFNRLQIKATAWAFGKIPDKGVQALSKAFSSPYVLQRLDDCSNYMTLLPTFPGSKRYKHNLHYTDRLRKAIEEEINW